MVVTETDLCNTALTAVGDRHISSLTDGSRNADLCATLYPMVRDRLLRGHPWNFAMKRTKRLQRRTVATTADILMTSNTTPSPYTAVSTPVATTAYMAFDGSALTSWSLHNPPFGLVDQENTLYLGSVLSFVATSVTVTTTGGTGTAIGTTMKVYGSNGGAQTLLLPAVLLPVDWFSVDQTFTFTFPTNTLAFTTLSVKIEMSSTTLLTGGISSIVFGSDTSEDEAATRFVMPTDCLRLWSPIPEDINFADYRVEGKDIITNGIPTDFLYISKVTDVEMMDVLFQNALSLSLAVDLCESLTQSNTKLQSLTDRAIKALREAKRVNGQEQPTQESPTSSWIEVRA